MCYRRGRELSSKTDSLNKTANKIILKPEHGRRYKNTHLPQPDSLRLFALCKLDTRGYQKKTEQFSSTCLRPYASISTRIAFYNLQAFRKAKRTRFTNSKRVAPPNKTEFVLIFFISNKPLNKLRNTHYIKYSNKQKEILK